MTTVRKIKSFVKRTKAILQGDDHKAIGEKNLVKADAAFSAHIQQEKAKTGDLEEVIAIAKEDLDKARLNHGNLIASGAEGRAAYVKQVLAARKKVQEAEKALKDHNFNLSILKEEQEELLKEEAED